MYIYIYMNGLDATMAGCDYSHHEPDSRTTHAQHLPLRKAAPG